MRWALVREENGKGRTNLPFFENSVETSEPIRVAICIPTFGQWAEEFRKSFGEFMYDIKDYPCGIHVAQIEPETRGALIHLVRTGLVKEALELHPAPDYILFVDSDMVVPPHFLQDMLAHKRDVVCARFHVRRPPFNLAVSQWRKNPKEFKSDPFPLTAPVNPEDLGTELVQVDVCGFGCVLIKSTVFDKLQYPWFSNPAADGVENPHTGDDIQFCKRCYDAGVKIYLDPTIKVGHETDKSIIVTPDNYKELQEGIYRVKWQTVISEKLE